MSDNTTTAITSLRAELRRIITALRALGEPISESDLTRTPVVSGMKSKPHWASSPEGRIKMSRAQRAGWKRRKIRLAAAAMVPPLNLPTLPTA